MAALLASLSTVNAFAVSQAALDGLLGVSSKTPVAAIAAPLPVELPAEETPRPRLVYPDKGILYYPDFENDIPDLAVFLKIPYEDMIYVYPPSSEEFHYNAEPTNSFTYTTQLADYAGLNAAELNRYKTYLKNLGFAVQDTTGNLPFPEHYANKVSEDLLQDVDFVRSKNGVYIYDNDDFAATIVIIFGRSVTYNADNVLINCDELRMYRIKQTSKIPGKTVHDFSQDLGF